MNYPAALTTIDSSLGEERHSLSLLNVFSIKFSAVDAQPDPDTKDLRTCIFPGPISETAETNSVFRQ